MSQIARYILSCFLLVMLLPTLLFAQTALDNPFAIFHGAKPKGKVDSVLVYRSPYEGTETYLYIYDRKGRLIKCNLYRYWVNPDFGTTHRDTVERIFTYNKNGKLISSRSPGDPNATISYKYIFTKAGYNIRTTAAYINGDSSQVFEMRFNRLGLMTQSGTYALNNLKLQRAGNFDYKYDAIGRLCEQTTYYMGHIPPATITYKYDSNGDELEMKRVDKGNQRISTYKYSNYDKKHNWTQQAIDYARIVDEDTIRNQYTIRRRITYYK